MSVKMGDEIVNKNISLQKAREFKDLMASVGVDGFTDKYCSYSSRMNTKLCNDFLTDKTNSVR